MRNLLILALLCTSFTLNATTYYVSTSGSDSNPGTLSQPWATWNYGFNHLAAGDLLYIRGGNYTGVAGGGSNKFGVRVDGLIGTSGSHITISAYPGETPILDCSALNTTTGQNVGFGIYNSSYVDFIGLTIANVTQHAVNANAAPGVYESNVTYITHTLCTIHHCGDGFTLRDSYNYIYYINCDVYEIADTFDDPSGALPGSLANGYYCAPAPGTHIYYTGCRAWNCSDDGWDEFGGGGYIEITNCWAFNNGWCDAGGPIAYTVGDGSGFKLGPTTSSVESGFQRTLKNCLAIGNLGPGIDQNASGSTVNVRHAIYNCITANNTSDGFQYYWDHVSTFKNNISYNNGTNCEFGTGSTVDHNSWQNGIVVSTSDFACIDVAELSRPRKADGSLPDITFLHLTTGSDLIDAGVSVGIPYAGSAPDLGAFEMQTGTTVTPPVFVSASVENVTPSLLEMTYDLTLANITPAVSSFSVLINSVARTVNSVAVSGTKVQLTLASPVVYGNIVTVTYTKPSANQVQTASGGQAVTINNQPVTNRVNSVNPVYISAAIANSTPSILEMTYNLTLANITPAASSFSVLVNSVARTVSSVVISGTKVQLTLATPIVYGDVVTVSYTKPSASPLQTTAGGQAISIGAQAVTNSVIGINPVYVSSAIANVTPSRLEMTYNMTLANIAPAASSFSVLVNSVARTVSSVVISGTKVHLTLATPIAYGDVVTVSYTKPSASPLQTTAGGQAITIGAQAVTNSIIGINPVYVSSAIANATPSLLEMTYNMTLANISPAASSFSVIVNSVGRTVSSVVVSGTKVQLTLASRILSGDIVTVTYTKPSVNPLQTTGGGVAISISSQMVINNCLNLAPTATITSPVINSSFTAVANITITVVASDADGSVIMVEFYNGSTKLGSSSSSPYSFTWNNVVAGNYALTAVATDNLNAKTTSSAVSISVNNSTYIRNKHPHIKISNPRKGNTYAELASITIDAVASDSDGVVSKVEFFNGQTKLVEMTTAPYTYNWKDVAAGTYKITAIATDNLNDTTVSSPIEFLVGTNVKYDGNSEIVNLFPNPNNGHFKIEFVNPLTNDKSEIVITDLGGKQVYHGPVLKEELSKEFDLSSSKSGVYVMLIKDKNIIVTKKFIKN